MKSFSISEVGSIKESAQIRAFVELEQYARNVRRELFGSRTVNEQAWVILQELFAARLSDEQRRASAVALATGMPVTTVLRYLEHLEQMDYVQIDSGPEEAADPSVRLTAYAVESLSHYYAIVSARLSAS